MRQFMNLVEAAPDFIGEIDPYTEFVEASAADLEAMVWDRATEFVAKARAQNFRASNKFKMADESDFIYALIERLQDAGFDV